MDLEKTDMNPPREKLFLLWNSIQRILPDLTAEVSKPTEDHESRIRRYYSQLLSNLNVPDVVTQMFQSGKLTAKEHEHVRQFHSTPIRASEELLEVIIINSRDVYECFLESLKRTAQHHVYQMLTSDKESGQSMSEHSDSRLIRQNYVWLTENLDPDFGLLSTLYANEVLSHREHIHIFSEKDPFVKNEILLSIISRKSVEDFKRFKIALNDTSQGHITKRLAETPVGDAMQNVTTTVEKTFPTRCSGSLGKRIPPKPPPKPKKQPPTLPSSKPMVIKPKPLLEPKIHPSKPNRIEKRRNFTKHEVVRKRSVEHLKEKFRGIPNELQTDVSTKIFLIHKKKSTDSIWNITFTKILEESRNIKRRNIMQAKAADENCERLMQEIIQRENECKIIKEDVQREKTKTKTQLRELLERVHELEDRRNLTENENKNLFAKLKKCEVEVESLKVLNTRQAQAVNEKVSIIEKLEGQLTHSEIKLEEMEAQLRGTRDRLIEKDLESEGSTTKLEEVQEMLEETEAKKNEFKAKLKNTGTGNDNLRSEDITVFNLEQKLEDERKLWAEEKKQLMEQTQKLQKESLDSRETYFNLEQELRKERTEKDGLNKQTQQYKRLIAELRYKLNPVLVQTIQTKAADKGRKSIFAMTILDKELFVVSWQSSEVDVYDSMKLSLNRQWKLKELIGPLDIGSCNKNKCLYIFDCKGRSGQSKETLRVDPNGKLINKWSTGDDWGYGLSVTDESNILLTVSNKYKLNEYSPDGQLIREINLSGAGIRHPLHAVKLPNGNFLVSHGEAGDNLHRVCMVDEDGNLKKSFGGKPGSGNGQLNKPFYLSVDVNGFVMVADQKNDRVLLLDSDLEFKRDILSRERKHTLQHPTKILLDESNGRLFVFDNEPANLKILIFDY